MRKRLCVFAVLTGALLLLGGCSSVKENSYSSYVTYYKDKDKFSKSFYDNITIEIQAPEAENGNGTIQVTIPDLAAIYEQQKEMIGSVNEAAEVQKLLVEHMGDCVITSTITEAVHKEGASWRLNNTEQIDKMIGESVDAYLTAVMADTGMLEGNINYALAEEKLNEAEEAFKNEKND